MQSFLACIHSGIEGNIVHQTCQISMTLIRVHACIQVHAMATSETSRPLKLQKLEKFRRQLPYISLSALEAVLQKVASEGVPELRTRKNAKQAMQQNLLGMDSYGPCIQQISAQKVAGGRLSIPALNICSFLQGVFSQDGYWTDMLLKMHERNPSTFEHPWHCIISADEVHPGNQLASSGRKTWCIYFSWLELTGRLLSHEEHWMTWAVVRSDLVRHVEGGISQCLRLLLEAMFSSEHGSPLHGILLKSDKNRLRLYWTLGGFLQDGAAQKLTWCNRQDGGSRVCMWCKNIFSIADEAAGEDEDAIKISAQYLQHSDLDINTDEEILASWDRLQANFRTCRKGEFNMVQQACGWTFSTCALMMSSFLKEQQLLKPISNYIFDWMHCMCSKGIMTWVIFWTIQSCQAFKPQVWSEVADFVRLWSFPGHAAGKTGHAASMFEAKRVAAHKKAGHLKCTASEILGVYAVLRLYMKTCILEPELQLQVHAFLAWCRVLDILLTANSRMPRPGELQAEVEQALQLACHAGWSDWLRPKFHWSLHFEQCLQRCQGLPCCFSTERKHKIARKYGSGVANTTQYETTVLSEVVSDHFTQVSEKQPFSLEACLLQPIYPVHSKLHSFLKDHAVVGDERCLTANTCRLSSSAICKKDDVVLFPDHRRNRFPFGCGRLYCFLQCNDLQCAVVASLDLLQHQEERHAAKWQPSADGGSGFLLLEVQQLVASLIYTTANDQSVTVLLPPRLRPAET